MLGIKEDALRKLSENIKRSLDNTVTGLIDGEMLSHKLPVTLDGTARGSKLAISSIDVFV